MTSDPETDEVRRQARRGGELDAFDRRILGALVEDATLTYAEIGRRAHLSAPAVRERVRRLKARGAIKGIAARLDGAALGRPLVAFVHVETVGWGKTPELMAALDTPEVEEMHSVAGDTCLIVKARLAGTEALERFLKRLYDVPTVKDTRSYIALSTYIERPTQAETAL